MPFPKDVPQVVIDEIRSHIVGACTTAETGYRSGRAQEDSVTGALGERLRLEPWKFVATEDGSWKFAVRWKKFRGARDGSREEGEIGADGIISFEVFRDYGEEVYTKGLLFQAKKDDDKRLCQNLRSSVGGRCFPREFRGFVAHRAWFSAACWPTIRRCSQENLPPDARNRGSLPLFFKVFSGFLRFWQSLLGRP